MTTTQFITCASATEDFSFWSNVSGTHSIDSTVTRRGPTSYQLNTSSPATNATMRKDGILSDTGSRISFWVNLQAATRPSGTINLALALVSGNATSVIDCQQGASGKLAIAAPGISTVNGTTVLQSNVWYHIAFSYVVTSATNFQAKVWLNGNLEVSINSTGTLTNTGSVNLRFDASSVAGANFQVNYDEILVDNGTDLGDPGIIGVTAKLPNANNTNSFDTAVGANPANRWTNVDERPLSTTNGWEQAGTTSVQENYGLQSSSTGDFDISKLKMYSRCAWVYGKLASAPVALEQHANNTGSTTGTTMTLGAVTVSVGQLMVVCFGDRVAGSTPTIADNLDANAWTILSGPTTSTVRLTKWYKVATTAGSLTATITFGSSSAKRAGAIGVFSTPASTPLDINATDNTNATSPFNCPATGTLAQANELIVAFRANASNSTLSATSPLLIVDTAAPSGSSSTAIGMGYQIVASTASVTPQFTGTSAAGVDGTASFKWTTVGNLPKLMDNGSETTIAFTSTNAIYTLITDGSTYPTNAAGIGLRSTGDSNATFLYECGTLIAYTEILGRLTDTVTITPAATVAHFATATLTAVVTITPTATVAHFATGALADVVKITATATVAHKATASLAEVVTITATGSVVHGGGKIGTASLTDVVTLTATATVAHKATGTLADVVTITPTATVAHKATASLTDVVTLTATATVAHKATGNLADVVTITPAATVAHKATGTLADVVKLTGSAAVAHVAAASLADVVTITATATVAHKATASLADVVTLTATGKVAHKATGTLADVVTITASGSVSGGGGTPVNGTANLTDVVTITATGSLTRHATAALADTVSITATGTRNRTAIVALVDTVSITATATRNRHATAAMTDTVSVTANGTIVHKGTALLSDIITLSAKGTIHYVSPVAALANVVSITANGTETLFIRSNGIQIMPYTVNPTLKPYAGNGELQPYSAAPQVKPYSATIDIGNYTAVPEWK